MAVRFVQLPFDQLSEAQQEQAKERFRLGDPAHYLYGIDSHGNVFCRSYIPAKPTARKEG